MRGGSGSGSGTSPSSSFSNPPYRNVFTPYAPDPRITFITTAPKFAIGQRAALIRTPAGTVLWDCLTLLDAETVRRVRDDFCGDTGGRLAAIVISHPHYYSTHVQWARAFACPVDLTDVDTEIPGLGGGSGSKDGGTGARALKLGGHFPGSLVLLFDGRLFIADTLVTTPAGLGRWEVDGAGRRARSPRA
ncbi:hypothetical protein ACCO45_009641 [Purpureocillium lilacinum]|uniref:Uncharacterized protein n=1 Tax=Purpureocillium lilacinum TaxID=33203 RepID=A0ACC4DN88_PURLI